MKMRRVFSAFLAAICMIASFGFCTLGVSAEDTRSVYATTSASVAQGSYGYCYVYLDDLTDLASLTVAVHYDTEKVTVKNSYNSVTCSVYDSSIKNGCLQFSYLFDGKGSNTKTQLFYFQYQVNSSAEAGETYFDIVISDAYNADLDVINISGSRSAFTIIEKAANKNCSIYSSSTVTTSVKEEFTISYRLNTYQIASGSFEIQYDRDLFELVELTQGGFLEGKVTDVNEKLDGAVAVSFVGTSYNTQYDLVTVRFKTLKNASEGSEIKLNVIDFYDLDLTPVSCNGYTTKVNVIFDKTYTEDSPAMFLSSTYDAETGKVTLSVNLEKDSHLGAGDFVLTFDAEKLTYVSSKKEFSPTAFNINEKNVANGILKFSIISTSDITQAQNLLTVTFDAVHVTEDMLVSFGINGNDLTDSMTNAIMLNFVESAVTIEGFLPGDVDGDGLITGKDVTLIRRYNADWDVDINKRAADVNADGTIDGKDVTLIRRYNANWNVTLLPGKVAS